MHYPFLFLLLLLGAAEGVSSTPLTLEDSPAALEAASGMLWLADEEYALSPPQARARLRAGEGQRLGTAFPTLGFRDGAHWFLLELENQSYESNWHLSVGRPHLDWLELWLLDAEGNPLDYREAGTRFPFGQRPVDHPSVVFPLELSPGESYSVLLRAEGEYVLDMPATLMDWQTFRDRHNRLYLVHGGYAGLILVMCLFNLLLFLSIRDRSYLWYVLYLGVFGLMVLTREGLSYQFLWPNSPWWNHHSITVLNMLTLSFSVFFARHFLELHRYRPRLDRWLYWLGIAALIAAPLSLMAFQTWVRISAAVAVPWVVAVVVIAALQMRAGYTSARYFMLAFIAVAIAACLYVLKNHEIIPAVAPLEYALQIGTSLEALLLSFALAHRMTLLKQENERIQREANEALEERVQERTRELNEALNARSEFLAVMSHEIRTPLNGIMGTVDMLRDSGLDESQKHHLHIIEQSSNSLLELIDDVLDYARIEAGKMPIEQQRFELDRLVGECVDLFSHRAQLNSNRLEMAIDGNAGDLSLGDPVRLRQVLSNLISNAVKFTQNGKIRVALHREEANPDYVYFEVEDTGIGMPREKLKQLFEHFHQLDNSSTRRYGGTGLGLAICRQLVEIMGGEIGVDSEEGKGSRFWFRLPLPHIDEEQTAEDERQADTGAADDEPSTAPARLLVVDDNQINLTVAEGLCRGLGHEVELAEGGMEAIALLMDAGKTFDLVLMDCEMPDMDGFETVRRIRELQDKGRVPSVPVVALTAHAVPDKIRACHEAGMISHIAKPISREKLNRELRDILGPASAESGES